MTDHVARMVHRWFSRAQDDTQAEVSESELVDAIHRMIREAEDETRRRCEAVAQHVAGPDLGGQIALAIRMNAAGESLPRKSLVDARPVYSDRSDH
jgi:2-oxo-4-hydroxy-4-carboxy--5-ureidoimidazoline (OHCU) decarboxylase